MLPSLCIIIKCLKVKVKKNRLRNIAINNIFSWKMDKGHSKSHEPFQITSVTFNQIEWDFRDTYIYKDTDLERI